MPLRGKDVLVQGSAPHSGILDYFDMKQKKIYAWQVLCKLYVTIVAGQSAGQKSEQDSTVLLVGPGTLYVHALAWPAAGKLRKNGWTAGRDACMLRPAKVK